ncbi:tyrosine-type recombinase/integrase [Desertivirga arenae]|uniref:tyrosine-type recombinase/integrase n=1 Tax=Desertivirga arenae TaxID=2810309 RepID=UPI001A96DC10|nr:tyrosine-type recombinase/integrase [Pedobacter sp. SYSU D00823]
MRNLSRISHSFNQLIFDAGEVLKNKLLRADGTVKWYRYHWRRMHLCLSSKGITEFNSNIGRQYLLDLFGEFDYAALPKCDKDVVKIINVLCEFYDTGTLVSYKERIVLDGTIGKQMKQFIRQQESLRLKPSTTKEREHYLSRFLLYLKDRNINAMSEVKKVIILDYLKTLDRLKPSVTHMTLRAIRCFLKYLFDQGLLKVDSSTFVPRHKYVKQARLPSVYKVDEVQRMISAIDRSRPRGKRDYAMVLIASRLGMRASDIAGLKFENLLWEQSLISYNQYKTGRLLQLRLLSDVGEAIIDYLKYARPVSKEPFVFLTGRSPVARVYSGSVTHAVQEAFKASRSSWPWRFTVNAILFAYRPDFHETVHVRCATCTRCLLRTERRPLLCVSNSRVSTRHIWSDTWPTNGNLALNKKRKRPF